MPAGHWMGLATCFIIFYSQLFCFHRHTACWLVGQCFKCANLRVLSSAWDNKMRNSFLKVSSCSPSDCLLIQNINRWRTELFFFSCRLIHPWLSLTLIKETWHWLNRLSTPQVLTKTSLLSSPLLSVFPSEICSSINSKRCKGKEAMLCAQRSRNSRRV